MYDNSVKVPTMIRWPGKIKPGIVTDLAANLDLYATFATLAGGDQPKDLQGYISKEFSGTLLLGEAIPRKQWLYSQGRALAFRSGNYKIHLFSKDRSSNPDTRRQEPLDKHDPPLLFDLSTDIEEQNNLSSKHPEIVARLLKEMTAFRSSK